MYHLVLVDGPWCLHGKEVYLYDGVGVGGIRFLTSCMDFLLLLFYFPNQIRECGL